MAETRKSKQINKFAILIHQLLPVDKKDALAYFSEKSIEKVSFRSEGLYIFFKEYINVIKSIRREKIEVKGLFYKIYPMVTNLTVREIGPYATNSTIEDVMQAYGFILDSYRVQETEEKGDFKTVTLTDDFRIVLDIPEVFMDFNLTPVRLPKITDRTFEVLFFCRFCRHNGHMQFQCPNVRKNSTSSLTCHKNLELFRRLSCENNSSDLVINRNKTPTSPQPDLSVYLGRSKTQPDSLAKTENKQNCFSDQNCYLKNKSHKTDSQRFVKTTSSKSKHCHDVHKIASNINIQKKYQQESFFSIPDDNSEKIKGDYPSTSKELSTEILGRRRCSEDRKLHQHCDNEVTTMKIQASTSNGCTNKRTSVPGSKRRMEKNKLMRFLSNLLPPNTDLLETEKMIKIALKVDAKDIPAKVEAALMNIQNYNCGLEDEFIDGIAKKFLKWIQATLNKIKQEKVRRAKTYKAPVKKKDHVKDGKSTAEIPKPQIPRKRKISLSLGIREAISHTPGELKPKFLCNFLNQVRNRRNLFEVASAFSKNIPALAYQLLQVQNTYYKYVQKRGAEEDRDISYIKRLRLRLLRQNKIPLKISSGKEKDMTKTPFITECDMTGTLEKTESDMTEVSMETESEMANLFVKLESDVKEISVKTEPDTVDLSAKTASDMREVSVKREQMTEMIPLKYEAEVFTKQTGSKFDFAEKKLFSSNPYAASYFTNITQMPFSLTPIKIEVDDMD